MSTDPRADMYPGMSPYNYVGNNPINAIDMKGDSITPIITPGGGVNGRDLLTINITGKILNRSNRDVNMGSALTRVKNVMESSFQGENINGYDMDLNFDFSVAESMDDVLDSDHLLILADPKDWNTSIPGASNIDPRSRDAGRVAIVDSDHFTGIYSRYFGQEGPRTSAHEMGHLLGLGHRNGDSSNLMSQGRAHLRGNSINASQLRGIQNSLISPTRFSPRLDLGTSRNNGLAIRPFLFSK